MERQAILESLKRAEVDVKGRVEAAEKQAAQIMDHAVKQAKSVVHDGEVQAAREAADLVGVARAGFAKDRQRVLAGASKDAEGVKAKANVKKVEDFFLLKFNESLHV